MQKNKRLRSPRMNLLSARLLASYLSILIVPLAAIAVIYNTAADLMYTVQYERMAAGLGAAEQEMERHLEESANLALHISTAGELSSLQRTLQRENRKATFYEIYELSKAFPNYSLFNSAIQDIYFFFSDQDYVIRLPTVAPATELGYLSVAQDMAGSYADMARSLGGEYRDMKLIEVQRSGAEQKSFGAVQTFPYGMRENPLGTILVVLSDGFVDSRLRANLLGDRDLVLILDPEGGVVRECAGSSCSADPAVAAGLLAALPAGARELRLGDARWAVCSAQSALTGYRFYSLVPRSVLLARIGSIKIVILVLSVLSAVVGLFTCVLLWSRKRRVVLRYSRYASEFGTVAGKGSNVWEGLQAVMDSASQLSTTIRLQSGIVRASVIRRLLDGEYTDPAALEQELRTAGITLNGTLYCAAAVTINRGFGAGMGESINEFRLHILGLVERTLEVPNYCCEAEDLLLAILFPLAGEGSLAIVREQLHRLEDRLVAEEYMEAYIGLGGCVSGLPALAESYSQARSVCEYLRFYNIRHVMDFRDMPVSDGTFYFPLEMELQFIRTIEQGNCAALQQLFGQLAVENYVTRHLTFEAQRQLLELVRCTAARALPEPDAVFSEKLEKAGSLEQIFVLLEDSMPAAAGYTALQEGQKAEEKRERIRGLMEKNYMREDFTISCIAGELGVSETRFYKDFKLLFGVSFSEYLENLRIDRACELLRAQTLIKDVSALVGYNSDYSFRRAFKRVLGVTPSAYMENLARCSD